ncbi:MAG: hypothetical protein KDB88_01825 [Flavobacteriales bacterium]|nr:hypothetical protein [Flavobacteriales bacterium]
MEKRIKKMMLAVGLLLAGGSHASGPVKVTGDVFAPFGDADQAVDIIVLGAAGDTLQWHETWTGHFKLHLPEEQVLTLRFSRPGCRTKEVVVDTRHALGQDMHHRRVEFGVELFPDEAYVPQAEGTVATIAFLPGSGLMAVERHGLPMGQKSTRSQPTDGTRRGPVLRSVFPGGG